MCIMPVRQREREGVRAREGGREGGGFRGGALKDAQIENNELKGNPQRKSCMCMSIPLRVKLDFYK